MNIEIIILFCRIPTDKIIKTPYQVSLFVSLDSPFL